MALIIGALAGALYAVGLWTIASAVGRRRGLAVGALAPAMLAVCAAAGAGAAACFPLPFALPAGTTLIGAIICAVVDARTGLIFDALSASMSLVAVILGLIDRRLADDAIAAAVIGTALIGLYLLSGRRGIGLGDVKLGSAVALGYGVGPACAAIGSAFILGGIYAAALLLSGRAKRDDAVRFGPFIAGGAAVGLGANLLGWPW